MFIEIEQDTYLILNAFHEEGKGRIEITPEQAMEIASSEFGHSQFMYIDGELIMSPDATSELKLAKNRARAALNALDFWKAIDRLGMFDAMESIRTDPATPRDTVIEFEKAQEFKRNWPLLVELAADLKVSEAQLDEAFGIS